MLIIVGIAVATAIGGFVVGRISKRQSFPASVDPSAARLDAGLIARARQRPALAAVSGALVVGFGMTTGVVIFVLKSHFEFLQDQYSAVTAVLTAGIFVFAVFAGLVAVLAYADSSRHAVMHVEVLFDDLAGNRLALTLQRDEDRARTLSSTGASALGAPIPLRPAILRCRITNSGGAVARNVTVAVFLEGIMFDPDPSTPKDPQWLLRCNSSLGWWQAEWQGGTEKPIYPRTIPRTPTVHLDNMWWVDVPQTPWGSVMVFADNAKTVRRSLHISVEKAS
jgi:hypothetical protein